MAVVQRPEHLIDGIGERTVHGETGETSLGDYSFTD